MKLFQWMHPRFSHTVPLKKATPPATPRIPEDQAVLCDGCHSVVAIRGFVIHANSGDKCPVCHSTNLKFISAWLRTPEEQKLHWEGRRVRMVKALSGGIPKPLPREQPLDLTGEKR